MPRAEDSDQDSKLRFQHLMASTFHCDKITLLTPCF